MAPPGPPSAPAVDAATLRDPLAAEPSVYRNLAMVYGVGALDMGLSLMANVVVPLAATKEAFADYRKVLLYAGYAGLSHVGLLSGMYLTVVGKTVEQVDWQLLKSVKTVLLVSQMALLVLWLLVAATVLAGTSAAWIGSISVACWGAINLTTFYNYFFQGTNRFRSFFIVNAAVKVAALSILATVALAGGATTRTLVLAFVMPVLATALIYEWIWDRMPAAGITAAVRQRWPDIRRLWQQGFVLHLANVCLLLLFTLGPLTVSVFFGRTEFADYAFVSGLVSILYVAVDGLTAAAIPLLARSHRQAGGPDSSFDVYASLVWAAPATFWIAAPAVLHFVPAYAASIPMLRVLCASLPMSLIVRSRAVAVETAAGRQGSLLRFAGWALACTTGSVLIAYAIGRNSFAVALGWTVAMIVIGCSRLFVERRATTRPSRSERRLLAEAAVATGLYVACAGGGQSPVFLLVYLGAAGCAFALRRRVS